MTGGEKTGNAQRDRAAKGLFASVLLHLLFFVLLGAAAMRLEQSRPSDPIYDVALIGAPGSSAPAPATAPAAPPAVQETPVEPTPPPQPDDIIEEKETVQEPLPEPVPQPQPQEPVQPPASPAATPTAPATGVGDGGIGQGAGDKEQAGTGCGGGNGDGIPAASDAIEAPTVPPSVLSSRAPEYPRSAQNRGTQGTVVVRFLLAKDGGIDDLEIVDSSGNNALDRAAMEAAEGFTFSPGLDGYGRPVRCYVYQSFTFRLE